MSDAAICRNWCIESHSCGLWQAAVRMHACTGLVVSAIGLSLFKAYSGRVQSQTLPTMTLRNACWGLLCACATSTTASLTDSIQV